MKHNYSDLNIAQEQAKTQKKIYQPSTFWLNASKKIVAEIERYGIENFRNSPTPLEFFVPNYGIPTNAFNSEINKKITALMKVSGSKKQTLTMEEFLSGYQHALSDYRVFLSSDKATSIRLDTFSEVNYGNPFEQFEFDGKKYSRSSLNYILGICFLKRYFDAKEEIKTVLEIGGGFGSLGEILSYSDGIKYIDIDIPPMSFIAWKYLHHIYQDNMETYINTSNSINIAQLKQCSVFNPWCIEKLQGNVDLFVNYISFQEMEPGIVKNYLHHIKRLNTKWILLRNIREGKNIKQSDDDGGVDIPIKTNDYIKMLEDSYTVVVTNVFPFGYKTSDGFHSELLLLKRITSK